MEFIGIPLAIVISILWYLPCVRAQGESKTLHKRDYIRAGLVYGLLYTCLLIIATEITWDAVLGIPEEGELGREILADFLRAALVEEFFKLTGFLLAKRKLGLQRKIDFILIAGLIGLVYSVVEKWVLGNVAAVIIGLLFPMHILWQFNQGGHYYEYEKAKAEGNHGLARREWLLAVCVPFLLHGTWDSALSIIGYCAKQERSGAMQILGGVLMAAIPIFGIIYTVKTIKKVRRIAKEGRSEVRAEQN